MLLGVLTRRKRKNGRDKRRLGPKRLRGGGGTVGERRTRERGDLRQRGGQLNRRGVEVNHRTKDGRESRLQSSPAEGVTITKAEEKRRGYIVATVHCGRGTFTKWILGGRPRRGGWRRILLLQGGNWRRWCRSFFARCAYRPPQPCPYLNDCG